MKKRVLSLLLCLVMVLSLMPFSAFAESDLHPAASADNDTMELEKYLTDNGNGTYDLTLEAFAKGAFVESETTVSSPLDVVLVLDQSLSMRSNDLRGGYVLAGRTDWTIAQAANSGVQYYYTPDGGTTYFPVYRGMGTLQYTAYNKKEVDETVIEDGMDPYSLTSAWAYSKTSWFVYYDGDGDISRAGLRPVYVMTRGYLGGGKYIGGWYTRFFYLKNDDTNPVGTFPVGDKTSSVASMFENRSDLVYLHSTNGGTTDEFRRANLSFGTISDTFHIRETLYKKANESNYDHLYYVNAQGNQVTIGKQATYDIESIYHGSLYYNVSGNRLEVMKNAVAGFAKSLANSAEKNSVDHKLAIVGFGGGEDGYDYPMESVTATNATTGANEKITADPVHRLGSNKYNYVNTGFFVENGQFLNFQEVTGYSKASVYNDSTSTKHLQYRYIQNQWVAYRFTSFPTSNGMKWTNIETGVEQSKTSKSSKQLNFLDYNFHDPDYTTQSEANYQKALFSVRANDTGSYAWNNGSLVRPDTESATLSKSNTANGVNDHIDQAIAKVDAFGESYVNHGMTMARNIFQANPDTANRKAQRVVVVFTDAHAGNDGEYASDVMGEALATSDLMKREGVTVYTVALTDSNTSDHAKNALEHMSSNYFTVFEKTSDIVMDDDEGATTYFVYNDKGEFVSVMPRYHEQTGGYNGQSNYRGFWGKRTDTGAWTIYVVASRSGTEKTNYPAFYRGATGNTAYYTDSQSSTNLVRTETDCTSYQWYVPDNGAQTGTPRIPVYYGCLWQDPDGNVYFPSGTNNTYMETVCATNNISTTQFYRTTGFIDRELEQDYSMQSEQDVAEIYKAFEKIAESVEEISTAMTLGPDDSVLRDILTTNFELPAGFDATNSDYVTVETVDSATNAVEALPGAVVTWTPNEDHTGDNVNVAGTLEVKGFDYTGNCIFDGHPGKTLRVTIKNLKPLHSGICYSNTAESGVYKLDLYNDKSVPVEYFPRPYVDVVYPEVTRVVDFNAPMILATNVANDGIQLSTNVNGEFTLATVKGVQDAVYTLRTNPILSADGTMKSAVKLNDAFTTVDVAEIVGKFTQDGPTEAKRVTVVPANSIYFDDELTTPVTAATTANGYGYNSGVSTSGVTKVTRATSGDAIALTFTGSRLDIYMKNSNTHEGVIVTMTDENGQRVNATVNGKQNASRVSVTIQHDVKDQTLVSVPVVTVDFGTVGTYTVKLDPGVNGFSIDGVRVYRPADESEADIQKAYQDDQELNAAFTQLRQLLLSANDFNAIESEEVNGVVFVDTKASGTADVSEYQKNGPKNEVYLEAGEGVAFHLNGADGKKVTIGMAAVEQGEGKDTVTVSLNGVEKTVSSNVDMYYAVTPVNGDVYIKNVSGGLLCVTNVKFSDNVIPTPTPTTAPDSEPGSEPTAGTERIEFTAGPALLTFIRQVDAGEITTTPVEDDEPSDIETPAQPDTPAQPETPTQPQIPSIHTIVKQILSSFVSSLFRSVSRLFGW